MKSNKQVKLVSYLLLVTSFWAGSNVLAADQGKDDLQQLIEDVQTSVDFDMSTMSKPPEGRMSWNKEMARKPDQLKGDIVRTPFTIGTPGEEGHVKITSEMFKGKTPIQIYNMEAEKLIDYVRAKNKALTVHPEKIGKFWVGEILYAVSQTMPILASAKAQVDNIELLKRWGGSASNDKTSVNITYSNNILTVAHSIVRKLKDIQVKLNPFSKTLTFITTANFNVKTGEVSWTFGYELDGKKVVKDKKEFPESFMDI